MIIGFEVTMCGIAGIYSFNSVVEPKWIKQAADILKHRGPDDEGFLAIHTRTDEVNRLMGDDSKVRGNHIDNFDKKANLFLAHRRLSIIDLSPMGHQPMTNKDKTIWIIYNGEVYNYIDLREELKSLGYDFVTNTDSEVVLIAYEEWGSNCVDKFNGMWAFVIYDRRKNILFGSRDRFGVKPLYYYWDKTYFAFASEIKALLKLPFVRKEINPRAVFDYLVLDITESEEEGFLKGIYELPCAHSFEFDFKSNSFRKERYYTLNYSDKWERFSEPKFQEYSTKIKNLLFDAMKLRLRSDVPIGSCLSGGLDSSTIVCVVNSLLKGESISQIGERQKVFTASYNDESIDESAWAKLVVDSTKTSWYRTYPTGKELWEDLERLIYIQDIPFSSTSIYAQYRVMKLAKENDIKVLLDGQGGDELFTGYAPYYRVFFTEMVKNFDIAKLIGEFYYLKNSPVDLYRLLVSLGQLYLFGLLPKIAQRSILKNFMKGNKYILKDFWQEHKDRVDILREYIVTSLNGMLYKFMTRYNLKTLLRYEDRNSMCFSIESRTPFADDINLIDYVFGIPSVYKIYQGWSKYLLRTSVKELLPEQIRYRKDKIGFATPERCWLNKIKTESREYITDNSIKFIDMKRILKDWDSLFERQNMNDTMNIWRFINFAVWCKVYNLI